MYSTRLQMINLTTHVTNNRFNLFSDQGKLKIRFHKILSFISNVMWEPYMDLNCVTRNTDSYMWLSKQWKS